MFKPDRTFSQRNNETGLVEWFFSAREGVLGPFQTKEQAKKSIAEFIQHNIKTNDDGGRSSGNSITLDSASFEGSETKRGKDKDRR